MARPVNEEKRRVRRAQILKEACSLFAEYGYSSATMAMLANHVGVTSGTLFQYFPSKEALFRAAVLEPLAEIQEQALSALQQEGTPLAVIQNMIDKQFHHITSYTNELRLVQYVLGQRNRFSDLTDDILESTKTMTDAIERVYKQGQVLGQFQRHFSPAMVSRAYLSYLNGVSLTIGEGVDHPEWTGLLNHAFYLFGPIPNEQRGGI